MIKATQPQPIVDEAAQAAAIESDKAAELVARARLDSAVRKLAGEPDGRFFLTWLFGITDPMGASGNGYREGVRWVAIRVKSALDDADPMLYPGLIAENAAAEAARRTK